MADSYLIQSRISEVMARRGLSRMNAIRRVTEVALAEVSSVHRYAVDTARQSLTQAESIQRASGKSLDEPAFQQLTADYLSQLTRITESAGVSILRVIDRALR